MQKLDLKRIVSRPLPEDQYKKELTDKKQIVLHHTVSGVGVEGDIDWWKKTPEDVATCMIVHHDGTPYQTFSSKYWAAHLGIKSTFLKEQGFKDAGTRNVLLDKASIGIEIDNLGGLVQHKGYWYAAGEWKNGEHQPNFKVPVRSDKVQIYPNGFRGFKGFEKYTAEQIKTVGELLLYWCEIYKIPTRYNDSMWAVSKRALQGESGIWGHISYRSDKSDVHPYPPLIEMLQQLENYG